MLNNWKTYKLSDFIDINPLVKLKASESYSFVEMKDLDANLKTVKPSDNKILKGGAKFQNGDTLFARITPCLQNGKICQVKDLDKNVGFGSTEFLVFRGKKNISDSDFVYYLSREPFVRQFAEANMIGTSGRQRVAKEAFRNIELELPPLQEQQSIASILSAIDDKIENNLAINKTLEEMAMALYKHWFVDFGPFQNGEFVESELGLIPKGWEVKKIGNVIETLGGGTPSTTTKEFWEDGDILWYSPTDLTRENSLFSFETAKKITPLGLQKSSAKMFPANSLLMSSRATVGLLTINTKDACTNQGFITMLPNENLSVYQLYFWVKQNMELIISKCNGSTFKEISKSNFRDLDIIVANDIEKYIEESKNIFEQIKNNTSENQTLTQLRDTLLPKLISGEVRLKEFREKVL